MQLLFEAGGADRVDPSSSSLRTRYSTTPVMTRPGMDREIESLGPGKWARSRESGAPIF
jgi:hypothetical protein